jgi:hypothetical protein
MIKQKTYFDVKVEALCPCIITYRIYAEDEHDALDQIDKKAPTSIRPNIYKKRNIKAVVYNSGSSLIKLIRNYIK